VYLKYIGVAGYQNTSNNSKSNLSVMRFIVNKIRMKSHSSLFKV
jgi:hypothetical protein